MISCSHHEGFGPDVDDQRVSRFDAISISWNGFHIPKNRPSGPKNYGTEMMSQAIRNWFVAVMLLVIASAGHAQSTDSVEYLLGAGDVIKVTVFQSPDLSLETRISETGLVTYPLIGQVRLGGLQISQAEKLLADKLRQGNFLKQPQVSILVMTVRGNQASVLGQVNRPGRYPLEQTNTRLSDLLAVAGGIAPGGSDVITVVGNRAGKPYRAQLDLPAIFSGGGQSTGDITIQNGDVVYVDRVPTVYIYGEVQRPGALRLERGMTVMQALATGGGLNQRGTEKGLRIHRRGLDGKVQVSQPAMDDSLKDGDVVYVRESLF